MAIFEVKGNTKINNNIDLNKIMKDIQGIDVLVGVPENNDARKEGTVTNAELAFLATNGVRKKEMINEMDKTMSKGAKYSKAYQMYIASHGSPLWHSPPRQIIEPAIEAYQTQIAEELKKAAQFFLENKKNEGMAQLSNAGLYAQGRVQNWFTDPRNNWTPNAPSTIKAKKGSDRPLIDMEELRKSISYVVREK